MGEVDNDDHERYRRRRRRQQRARVRAPRLDEVHPAFLVYLQQSVVDARSAIGDDTLESITHLIEKTSVFCEKEPIEQERGKFAFVIDVDKHCADDKTIALEYVMVNMLCHGVFPTVRTKHADRMDELTLRVRLLTPASIVIGQRASDDDDDGDDDLCTRQVRRRSGVQRRQYESSTKYSPKRTIAMRRQCTQNSSGYFDSRELLDGHDDHNDDNERSHSGLCCIYCVC